jgi:aldehyde:ferredoxin oxidoreductase
MQPLLKVDLTSGIHEIIDVAAQDTALYLGGASLAARILYPYLSANLDPLAPSAPLLFLTGPLTGTAGPAVGRFIVAARSPATGLWGESNCGGFWGAELRQAGYAGLLITGAAPEPVYLWVDDDRVELRAAAHLWGQSTDQTQSILEAELGPERVRIAAIGQAGEAGIPFALILCDHGRVAGRTGMGAVMGSKNLKAIAVLGHGRVPLHSLDKYAQIRGEANRRLRTDSFMEILRSFGSAGGADYFDYLGEMPKRYFQRGEFAGAARISGASVAETIQVGVSTCHGCVVACGRVVQLGEGGKRKGPEYETLVGFGPNLWIADPAAITRLGELCDQYGMDSISMSNTIGLAFKLFEDGQLTEAETGGLALHWGDIETVETLVHLTARREGFGGLLARGARALGKHVNAEEEAVQVNGLEVPYHDPRGTSGMALVYATSPRGACHNQSDYFLVDIGQVEGDIGITFFSRHARAEKAANVARHQDWRTTCNALVQCIFANVSPRHTLALVNAALGLEMSMDDLVRSGERAWNLKRVINNRFGLERSNDRLPKALLQPLPDGGSAGYQIDLESMLMAYYQARGWDPQTGYPLPETLNGLGLDWVVEDLWPAS